MRLHDRLKTPVFPRGCLRLWDVRPGAAILRATKQNQIQSGWAYATAKLLGFGTAAFRIQAMYLEFENVADPDDTVSIPDYDTSEGIDYYNDLSLTASRDFLRVPLITAPALGVAAGYASYFTGDAGNKLSFFSQSQGTEGIHGKAFGAASNSKVCGAALVSTPDYNDRTQDLIIARTYVDAADQILKSVSKQIGASWDLEFVF